VRDIKQRFGLPVMKAIPVGAAADLAGVPGYAAAADRILFDARAPKDATRPGGLGVPFDWHLLEGMKLDVPFMLSGGLSIDNVAEAVAITRPDGVDVSSGVESAPGVKDPDMIRAFIRAARAAEANSANTKVASRA
jgi:phosphoribosylanthranilate isomerase